MIQTENEILLKVEQFTGCLYSKGTKKVSVFGCEIQAQQMRDCTHALVRIHKAVEEREVVAWLELPVLPNNHISIHKEVIDRIPQGEWNYEDVENPKAPIGAWIPISYQASFRRSGDLNSSDYWGKTYQEAYEQVSELDSNKAWKDDCSVKCFDGAPYWWAA